MPWTRRPILRVPRRAEDDHLVRSYPTQRASENLSGKASSVHRGVHGFGGVVRRVVTSGHSPIGANGYVRGYVAGTDARCTAASGLGRPSVYMM